ncbi:MAG TPA: hypothetical protein VGB65_03000 [Allosphingosinicella sp.]
MKKYEIWGDDDSGKQSILAYATLDSPALGDTVLVRSQIREIEKVWRHHAGTPPAYRVRVSATDLS